MAEILQLAEPGEYPPDRHLQVKIFRAAALLDCSERSERTVRRLLKAGELASVGRGRLRRVEHASILTYIARHRNPPTEEQRDGRQ